MSVFEANNVPERDYLSPHEFVARSGLSLATVRRYLRTGRLPSLQPGGRRCRVLIPAAALERFTVARPLASTNRTDLPETVVTPAFISKRTLPGPTAKWRRRS